MFYHYSLSWEKWEKKNYHLIANGNVNVYYGITRDPITQDTIFIMPYYDSDLTHYITKDFFNTEWFTKIREMREIINGLAKIHEVNIIHRDYIVEIFFLKMMFVQKYVI
jgi:hypothetical protein